MRKYARIPGLLILIAGIAGYYFRSISIRLNLDSYGLPIPGAVQDTVLVILTAAVFLLCVVFSAVISIKLSSKSTYNGSFAMPDTLSFPELVFSLLLLLAMLWGCYLSLREYIENRETLQLIFTVLAVSAAVSLFKISLDAYKNTVSGSLHLLSVLPPLFMCVWMVVMYKDHSADPVLSRYAYQCAAYASCALSFYYTAGYVYEKSATFMTIFTSIVSVYFCCVTLADYSPADPGFFILVGIIFHQLLSTIRFLWNLKAKTAAGEQPNSSHKDFTR